MMKANISPKICAIIPARGGSKRIPRKNLVLVGGEPLIVHSIKHAMNTDSIDKTIISTDDLEIASIVKSFGAEIVMRPDSISGAYAKSEDAILYTLDYLREKNSYIPDIVVFIQATSPIRKSNTIENALQFFIEEQADSLFTACTFPGFLWRLKNGDYQPFNFDYKKRQRHQDAPEDLMENGSFFIFKTPIIYKYHNRLGGKITAFKMSKIESFEIDNYEDLALVDFLLKNRNLIASM